MSHRRGFALLELLTVIGLLGPITLVAGYLFTATVRLNHATGEARNAAVAFDAAIEMLRADVWSAGKLESNGPGSVTLRRAGDKPVTWSIVAPMASRSVEGEPVSRWSFGEGAEFLVDGVELIVRVPGTRAQRGGELRLPSQVQLLNKGTP